MKIEAAIPLIRTICQDSGNRHLQGINAGWNCGEQAAILNRCALAVGLVSVHHRGEIEAITKNGREYPYLHVRPHHFCVIGGSVVDPSVTLDHSLSSRWEEWNIQGIRSGMSGVRDEKIKILRSNSPPLGESRFENAFKRASFRLLIRYYDKGAYEFPFHDHKSLMKSPVSQYLERFHADVPSAYDSLIRALELVVKGELDAPLGTREEVCAALLERGANVRPVTQTVHLPPV